MKLLLDENLPHKIRHELPGHDVYTAAYMGWDGIENGHLLRLAADAGFDVVIANDKGLEYQQDLASLPVSVVVLLARGNTVEAIRPLYPELLAVLATIGPRQFVKLGQGHATNRSGQ